MRMYCRRRAAATAATIEAVAVVQEREPVTAEPKFEGRWHVVHARWAAEFRQALARTRGNVELAVAIAATMVFAD